MSSTKNYEQMARANFEEMVPARSQAEPLTVDDLRRVRLNMTAELGHASLLVREVLELKQGSIIPLDKAAGEMTEIHLNGIPLARGEVVIISDSIHVRIAEILGLELPEKDLNEDD
jgi:flagellar motor switch protein FliN/FliY